MKRKLIWLGLCVLLISAMLLASCSKSTTTQTTTKQATTSVNWWDKLGQPQYGGSITIRYKSDPTSFDNFNSEGFVSLMEGYQERLFADQWTMDPAKWDYAKVSWRPDSVNGGNLAKSWEFSDPSTIVVHLRQGVHWQNLPPANGREFIADDVVYNNNRLYALGGMPGSAVQMTNAAYKKLVSVTATDNYTVVFKWSIPNPTFILSTMEAPLGAAVDIECPEVIKASGPVITDWHKVIGTGPFMLTDFTSGSSATFAKNPNYWGYDERYPKNKLPYVDELKVLIIPDDATAMAALRTAKIDVMPNLSNEVAQTLLKSNPELLSLGLPASYANSVDPRGNTAPFSDIRVRKAMQMAIDLPTIAKTYYGGTCSPDPSTMTSNNMGMGWGYPYSQWPQSLKDEYAFNPAAAKKLLADAGFPTGFKTNIVADAAGDMNLLQIVKSNFMDVGIDMEIRTMPTADWTAFVITNHKQDQLTQRSSGFLGMTFDIDRQMQRFVTGANWAVISDPTCDSLYAQTLAANSVDVYQKAFNDMNKYIAEQHFMISLLTPTTFNVYQPYFKGFAGQDDSVFGNSGPRLLGFYNARFWVDQTLKKSLGH